MRDDEMAAIERDLARLLSVAPSPEFAARVRTRIEQQPLRVFTRRRWLLMSAVAAVIVVALVMARRGTSVPPPVTPVQADRWLPPQLAPAPSVLPAAPTYAGTVPQHARRSPARAEPEVLVDPTLARAVRRLAMERPVLPEVPPEPSLDPVVVEPLRMPDVAEFAAVRPQADQGRR